MPVRYKCSNCKKEFTRPTRQGERENTYCSAKCRGEFNYARKRKGAQKVYKLTCDQCGAKFTRSVRPKTGAKTFCSKKCGQTYHSIHRWENVGFREEKAFRKELDRANKGFEAAFKASDGRFEDARVPAESRLRHHPETIVGTGASSSSWAVEGNNAI